MASVTVVPPFQVQHDGEVYTPGQTAEVPDAVAQQWLTHGWVGVKRKAPAKKATP